MEKVRRDYTDLKLVNLHSKFSRDFCVHSNLMNLNRPCAADNNHTFKHDFNLGLPLTQKGLIIYHHNICSLLPKVEELAFHIKSSSRHVDIYGIS